MSLLQRMRRIVPLKTLLVVALVSTELMVPAAKSVAAPAVEADPVEPAFTIPLFPQKERDLKRGLPPGMTPYSFWAARGTMALTKVSRGKVKVEFEFEGLIPYGVYTLWNVLETEPFKNEPLGAFGYSKHALVADGSGRAHKVVILDKWPGKEFLLDYHADGKLSQTKGVYPGALWGRFPREPKR